MILILCLSSEAAEGAELLSAKSGSFSDNRLSTPVVDQEVCRRHAKYIDERLAENNSIDDLVDSFQKSGAQVLNIGEAHGEPREAHALLIRALKKKIPELNCVILEQPRWFQPFLDRFNSDKNLKANGHVDLDGKRYVMPLMVPNPEELRDLNIQIHAVDDDSLDSFSAQAMTRRNGVMAKNTAELIESGKCTKSVMIVGAAHMWKNSDATSLPDYLKLRKVSVYKAAIVQPGYSAYRPAPDAEPIFTLNPSWIWSTDLDLQHALCKTRPPLLKTNQVLFRDKEKCDLPFTVETGKPSGNWCDFDAIYLPGALTERPKGK